MITSDNCIKVILNKFPEFEAAWNEHLEWWDGDEPGFSNDMSAFSDFIIDLLQEENNQEYLKNIFLFVEQLMIEGDEDVQNAVATCFLENLLNASSRGTIDSRKFISLLGDESRKYCKAWDKYTDVKTDGLWDDKH